MKYLSNIPGQMTTSSVWAERNAGNCADKASTCSGSSILWLGQVRFLRRQYLQHGDLPFTNVLLEQIVAHLPLRRQGTKRVGDASHLVGHVSPRQRLLSDRLMCSWTEKRTMQMEIVRRKTPELVRKEIWTHLLAYNLIRTIIAQAATTHGIEPRSISFKGAIQTLEAFQPVIAIHAQLDFGFRMDLYQQLLDAIAIHRVADRPDRCERRLRKRRPKHYGFLRKPRHQTKCDMVNGVSKDQVPFITTPSWGHARRTLAKSMPSRISFKSLTLFDSGRRGQPILLHSPRCFGYPSLSFLRADGNPWFIVRRTNNGRTVLRLTRDNARPGLPFIYRTIVMSK